MDLDAGGRWSVVPSANAEVIDGEAEKTQLLIPMRTLSLNMSKTR